MNAKGHSIESIYMSGGQAKNVHLMQLFADVIGIPIVLPENSGAAVVLGAAMLGRMANDARAVKQGKMSEEDQCEALWKIMVDHFSSYVHNLMCSPGMVVGRDDTDGNTCRAGGQSEREEAT